MHSKRLKEHGLNNWIGGSDYNFRQATAGENIVADIKRLLEQADIQPKQLYTGQQTHGKHVAYCDGENGEPFLIGRQFPNTDGLLTNQEGIALLIKFADCTPVVLYDPKTKVQAVVHSGWRSTVEKISHVALRKMVEEYNVNIRDVIAYVGPSIGIENYEVGSEVYEAFKDHKSRDLYFEHQDEKYLLDMSLANYQLLIEAGIEPDQIEMETTKTYGTPSLHSAREEGKEYGLNAMVTMIR